ncbi:trypsin-like peptidase domain-containing protein [Streptomyces sp. NPDC093546]|uniref:trypsin-like peptidase domain-containing protein n=1 Tax=Streptomyces sp. NPDC093546 TaxID=3366040 RepID=UPI0038245320
MILKQRRIALVDAGARGSGFLLTGRLVLTAAHVLKEGAQPKAGVPGGTGLQRCEVVWSRDDDRCDAALLLAEADLVDAETAASLPAVVWGRVTTLDPRPGCQAIGYPDAAWAGGRPDTEQLVGTLKPGSSLLRGRYVLDNVHGAPAPGDGPSPWSGMSGAALFVDGVLVGVASGDPVAWGHGRVEAVPAHVLVDDAGFMAALRRYTGRPPAVATIAGSGAGDDGRADGGDAFGWGGVDAADPAGFGVHRLLEAAGLPDHIDYVPRDCDEELDARIGRLARTGGMLLVTGDSAAGKTRALFEAMRRTLAGWSICHPDPDAPLTGLAASVAQRGDGGHVLWLDDLQMYLRPDGLTPRLLQELTELGCVVLATMRSEFYRPLVRTGSARQGAADVGTQHSAARVVRASSHLLLQRTWTEPERTRARKAAADPRMAEALAADAVHGVAEYLAAGPQTWNLWKEAAQANANPRGAALVAAAVDLARTGLRSAVDKSVLETLHGHYLDALGGAALRPEPLEEAWEWATEVLLGVTSPLIPAREGRWRPFDYLVSATARTSSIEELPEETWRVAVTLVGDADWDIMSLAAQAAARVDVAIDLLIPRAEAGNVDAMVNLGGALLRADRRTEAERWWVEAAGRGDGMAAHNVGCLEVEGGNLTGARGWFLRAVERGVTESFGALGRVAELMGEEQEAVEWWRKGSELGDAGSALSYSDVLRRDWNHAESLDALRVAAEAGMPYAALSYAGVLLCRDEVDQANAFLGRAYAGARRDAMLLGDQTGMLVASVVAMALGDLETGRDWERRAADAGSLVDWTVLEREGTERGLRAVAVDQGTLERLGDSGVRSVMAHLWAKDCMDCGHPLGEGVPALCVDEAMAGLTFAKIFHFGMCRFPRWNDSGLVNLISGSGASWWSEAVMIGDRPEDQHVVMVVNPSAEYLHLEPEDRGSRRWRVAGPVTAGADTVLKPLNAPGAMDARGRLTVEMRGAPRAARLVDDGLLVQVGLDTWGVGLPPAFEQCVRRRGGFLLVVTSGLGPPPHDNSDIEAALEAVGTLAGWISLVT